MRKKYFNTCLKKIIFLVCFLASSFAQSQTLPAYSLVKVDSIATSSGSATFQWIAGNQTNQKEKFFIFDSIPSGYSIEAVNFLSSVGSGLQTSSPLPLSGPAFLTIGPFSVDAGASVTLSVLENKKPSSGQPGQPLLGETFALLSQSQESSLNSNSSVSGLTVEGTTTEGSGGGLLQSAVAGPNVSRVGQPIRFYVSLGEPAKINLSIFTLAGEEIFDSQVQGIQGKDTLDWPVQNNLHQPIASGLYLYFLRVTGNGAEETKTGKLLVIR